MSIDATVLCGWRWCANFEIDGPVHFHERLCIRTGNDAEKEMLLLNSGWGLMRLHYRDANLWGSYVKHHVMRAAPRVLCTESYEQYLMGEQGSLEIIHADRLEEVMSLQPHRKFCQVCAWISLLLLKLVQLARRLQLHVPAATHALTDKHIYCVATLKH